MGTQEGIAYQLEDLASLLPGYQYYPRQVKYVNNLFTIFFFFLSFLRVALSLGNGLGDYNLTTKMWPFFMMNSDSVSLKAAISGSPNHHRNRILKLGAQPCRDRQCGRYCSFFSSVFC
jgi:hypothetical protein